MPKTALTPREREIRCIRFEPVDRLPFRLQFGLMPGLLEKWHAQGLPHDLQNVKSIADYFGLDRDGLYLPVRTYFDPPFEQTIIRDNDRERIEIDLFGRQTRLLKEYASKPLPLEYPVSNWDSWLSYKKRLTFHPGRIRENLREIADQNMTSGYANRIGVMGFFWMPRELMGLEELCMAYFERPDLVHDILDTWCSLLENVLQHVCETIVLDRFHLAEDMAYKNGPIVGKEIFDTFVKPYYQRIYQVLERFHVPIFSVDSDGNLDELIAWFQSCGVNLVGPCEVQAGCDLVAMRGRHGQSMAFLGGLDKRVVPQGNDAIDEMLEAIVPSIKEDGGWIVSLDHRVLNETQLEDFRYFIRRTKEMITYD